MQLHAYLLLFIITTDKTLAFSHHECGGNVSLDQNPSGHITLAPPGPSTEPSRLVSVSHQTHPTSPVTTCTWTVALPPGRAVLLKPLRLDSETSISVHCVWSEDPRDLRGGGAALLSGCDNNKANLTLTGTGWSSDTVQLDYYVQEDERNSSEDHTRPHSDPDLVRRPQTGTSLTIAASVGQEAVSVTEGSSEGLGSTSVSGPASVAQRLRPTSPTPGLAMAGRADRETLPFPEEEANNGADTSAPTHLADHPMAASERTHPYFHTQHTPATGGINTETHRGDELPKTQGVNAPTSTTSLFRTDTHTTQNASEHTHTADPTVSAITALLPRGVTVGGPERPPDSWRSQRSTDGLDVNPSVTHDPSKAPGDTKPTMSSSPTHATEPHAASGAAETVAFFLPNASQSESVVSAASVTAGHSDTESVTHSLIAHTPSPGRGQTRTTAQRDVNTDSWSSASSSLTPTPPVTLGDGVQGSAAEEKTHKVEAETPQPTRTLFSSSSPTLGSVTANSQTPLSPMPSSTPEYTLPAHTWTPTASEATTHTPTSRKNLPLSSSPRDHEPSHESVTNTHAHQPSSTTKVIEEEREGRSWRWSLSNTTAHTPTAEPSSRATPPPTQDTIHLRGPSAPTLTWSSTTTQTPKIYIVPDRPAAIRVESIELLLQIVVEESASASSAGLVEDTAAWVEPYLLRASGYSRLMGVWSSGHAVQSLVEFHTSGALQWLSAAGPASLLEQSGLAQAVRQGRSFRSSKITNITLGGLQGDVCDWLLQCPAGYKCESQPGTANYSCSSVCHFDFCHHHGICTHHPGQLPVCRCLVGEDFWFMGKRCDVRMTRARLVGSCLAILLIMVAVIAALAFVAVRRYRAVLIQAKVDQTRSSYRRFNHFDELSGRFWLRSLPGSADSLDNPAFTRSDELLHLRALDRPCCYHDDTLSLASTCPSHGARINTIYPHSSQYGWRGSEMSMGDGVLDSGKASDLSVCSWPVEPIHWTPFPLLQQLAAHRTPTVRVTRPRSYCEGMELVDLGKSWTA